MITRLICSTCHAEHAELRMVNDGGNGITAPLYLCEECYTTPEGGPSFDDLPKVCCTDELPSRVCGPRSDDLKAAARDARARLDQLDCGRIITGATTWPLADDPKWQSLRENVEALASHAEQSDQPDYRYYPHANKGDYLEAALRDAAEHISGEGGRPEHFVWFLVGYLGSSFPELAEQLRQASAPRVAPVERIQDRPEDAS